MQRSLTRSELRNELEHRLTVGRCAYCRTLASPDRPLTREHLIPRSKGGGRHDPRIIVPACSRCNHRRGCQELTLFLLTHPCRISALLDHFSSLPPDSLQHVDQRVFAELYAALWVLNECAASGAAWRKQLRRFCGSRTIHRRRYAARRIVVSAAERLRGRRDLRDDAAGPSCLLPPSDRRGAGLGLDEPLEVTAARLMTLLSLVWGTPAEEVELALRLARRLTHAGGGSEEEADTAAADDLEPEAARKRKRSQRQLRVDQRRGRAPRQGSRGLPQRRAA